MRYCRLCGNQKSELEFYFRKDSNSFRTECKACCRSMAKRIHGLDGGVRNRLRCHQNYIDNTDRRRLRYDSERLKKVEAVSAAKSKPCLDCKVSFPPWCMDFDHVPEKGEKIKDVSRMVHGTYSLESVLAEIEKCDLVCACCHRIRTHKRMVTV